MPIQLRYKAAVTLVAAALVITPLTAATASAAPLPQCQSATFRNVGGGWQVFVPDVWEDWSTTCNLRYGDLPHRDPKNPFGNPTQAIQALQSNLNYCYGSKLSKDGLYGAKTRDAVKVVQGKLGLTKDGIYGPRTRSAMKWRMWNPSKKVWSQGCYDKL
ncbi:peptidoglycan-binding domain-containing protein [Kribbella sp. NPDC056951]|uniref:peptidoglycan-binding domain-containing protein n=1 Tax=Kribbella sp. NPDC056951 TaxID=3345978 RepID=UPI00363CBCF4